MDIQDQIFMSNNYGPFRVLYKNGKDKSGHTVVRIQFINSGYQKDVLMSNVRAGNVKDDTINPIRNISEFSEDNKQRLILRKLREIWHSMISRCTNESYVEYKNYGQIGIKIDPSWMIWENFYNDCITLFQYDKFYNNPFNYQLDKDYLQINIPKYNRIYSKNTCIFLSNRDNTNLRAIENKINKTSKYFGVCKIRSLYYMNITCNRYDINMYFSDEIAAANAYNYWFEKLHLYDLVPLHNDVPYMPPDVWTKYITSRRRQIYSLIK